MEDQAGGQTQQLVRQLTTGRRVYRKCHCSEQ
jgi:hypothetical protein